MLLDDADTNSIKPTKLDISKINSIEIGDYFDGELDNWRVLKYKDSWVCLLYNHHTKKEYSEFKSKEELIEFLNN